MPVDFTQTTSADLETSTTETSATKQWTSANIPPAQKPTTKNPSIAGKVQTAI